MSHYLTRASHARLSEELHKLRSEDLMNLSRAKNTAAREGDLSENAEYHAAREQLEQVQRRIHDLETQLRAPRFIEDLPISCARVSIGTRVLCLDLESDEEVTYTLLGEADAVPAQNVISYQSALGRGLVGKELDDDVDIALPAGTRHLRILDIQRFDSD
jgi:transcription elongation factor GreA